MCLIQTSSLGISVVVSSVCLPGSGSDEWKRWHQISSKIEKATTQGRGQVLRSCSYHLRANSSKQQRCQTNRARYTPTDIVRNSLWDNLLTHFYQKFYDGVGGQLSVWGLELLAPVRKVEIINLAVIVIIQPRQSKLCSIVAAICDLSCNWTGQHSTCFGCQGDSADCQLYLLAGRLTSPAHRPHFLISLAAKKGLTTATAFQFEPNWTQTTTPNLPTHDVQP